MEQQTTKTYIEIPNASVELERASNNPDILRVIMFGTKILNHKLIARKGIYALLEFDTTNWTAKEIRGHIEMVWDYTIPDYMFDDNEVA